MTRTVQKDVYLYSSTSRKSSPLLILVEMKHKHITIYCSMCLDLAKFIDSIHGFRKKLEEFLT